MQSSVTLSGCTGMTLIIAHPPSVHLIHLHRVVGRGWMTLLPATSIIAQQERFQLAFLAFLALYPRRLINLFDLGGLIICANLGRRAHIIRMRLRHKFTCHNSIFCLCGRDFNSRVYKLRIISICVLLCCLKRFISFLNICLFQAHFNFTP